MRLLLVLLLLPGCLAAANPCLPGAQYNEFLNVCYTFMNSPRPFIAAEQMCVSLRGHLTSIWNAFDNNAIANQASFNFTATSFWIGGSDLYSQHDWVWMDWREMLYTRWAAGEPMIQNGQCVAMDSATRQWIVHDCTISKPFVCETPVYGTTAQPNTRSPTEPTIATTAVATGCDPRHTAYYAAFLIDTSSAQLFSEDNTILTMWTKFIKLGQVNVNTEVAIAAINRAYLEYPDVVRNASAVPDAFLYMQQNSLVYDFDSFNIAGGIKMFLESPLSETQKTVPFIVIVATTTPSDVWDLSSQLAAAQQRGFVPLVVAINGVESSFEGLLPTQNIFATTSSAYYDITNFLAQRMCEIKPSLAE